MNTTGISIPYNKWYRDIYNAPFPVFIERRAGVNPYVPYTIKRPTQNTYNWVYGNPKPTTIYSMCGKPCVNNIDTIFEVGCNTCQRNCICNP